MLPVIENDEGLDTLQAEIDWLFDGGPDADIPVRLPIAPKGQSETPAYRSAYWHMYYLRRKLLDPSFMEKRRKYAREHPEYRKRWKGKDNER